MKSELKKKLGNLVIHPYFFAIVPLIYFISKNVGQVQIDWLALTLGFVSISFTFIIFIVLNWILRNKRKAGLIVTMILGLLFFYDDIYWVLQGSVFDITHKSLLIFWGALLVIGICVILNIRKDLKAFTTFLNSVGAVMILISLINIGVGYLSGNTSRVKDELIHHRVKTDQFPDIYYIILDGYAHFDTLRKIYGYDNSLFYDFLKENGFYIPDKSLCNYPTTLLSLASSLNMRHLPEIKIDTSKTQRITLNMIQNAEVMRILKAYGYKFLHFGSIYWMTNTNRMADIDYQCGVVNEFLWMYLQSTIYFALEQQFHFIKNDIRKTVLCAFSSIHKVFEIQGPKVIFAHIVSPHRPYLFDREGKELLNVDMDIRGHVKNEKEKYLYQLIFINQKIKDLVNQIFSNSQSPPIIILQADHGPDSFGTEGWRNPTLEVFKEKMRIFNAYYLPGKGNEFLYETITPVNTFRVIFNAYFNENFKLLDDNSYFLITRRDGDQFLKMDPAVIFDEHVQKSSE